MVSSKIHSTYIVLLLISCAYLTKADPPNHLEYMTKLSKDLQVLGKNTLCVGDHGEDAATLTKAYKVFDATVAGVKANGGGTLDEEKFAKLVKIIVADTSAGMHSVDAKCAEKASTYCPTSETPAAAKTLSALGKALLTMGSALECLLADPKPEILGQIPVIMGTAIHKVANHKGDATTSVGILLPEIIGIAGGFQSLSSVCAHEVKIC